HAELHRRKGARSAEELLTRVATRGSEGASETSRDQLPHDLRRSSVDAQNSRIRKQPADLVFAHKAIAAEELQALVDEASVHLRHPEVCCRRGIRGQLTAAMLAQALINIGPANRKVGLEVRQLEARVLKCANRLSERLALPHVDLGDVKSLLC